METGYNLGETQQVIDGYNAGLSCEEISRLIDKSVESVEEILNHLKSYMLIG